MTSRPASRADLDTGRFRSGSAKAPSAATLDHVDFDLERGEMVALVGESGSGKSLLAHTIAGILDARRARLSRTP